MIPFFSIVTEVYNREATISRTINSILNQSFLDFEYIIVEFNSTDNSVSIIEEVLSKNNNNVTFLKNIEKINEIERWNYPLEFAQGKYIVVLEGDDWFETDYLKIAYKKLVNGDNIGIYIGPRLEYKPLYNGLVKNEVILREFLMLNFVPPPSEAIFIRTNFYGKPFYYDSKNYIWAAESSLYREILLQGFNVYFEFEKDNNIVFRGISPRNHSIKHVKDMLMIVEHNKTFINENDNIIIQSKIAKQIGKIFAMQLMQSRFEIELFYLFLAHSFKSPNTIYFFLNVFKTRIKNHVLNLIYPIYTRIKLSFKNLSKS